MIKLILLCTAMSSTIRQLIAMGAQLRLVDGDLWLDMEGEYDVEDDVITIGDIRTAFLFGKEYGPDGRSYGMCHTGHIREPILECSD